MSSRSVICPTVESVVTKRLVVPDVRVSCRLDAVSRNQGLHDTLCREPVRVQFVRINVDHDGALIAAKRRRRRNSRQRRKDGPDAVQREVLDFAKRARLAGKDQVADRQRAGVIANHEGRNRAGRHEGASAIHIGNRLRQRLAHVRARMKCEPEQRRALNRFCLDALDAVDVEEVVLVVVRDEPFHLLRAHPAVGLGNINDRADQIRENIDARSQQRKNGRRAKRDDDDDHRDRPSQRSTNQPHGYGPP